MQTVETANIIYRHRRLARLRYEVGRESAILRPEQALLAALFIAAVAGLCYLVGVA